VFTSQNGQTTFHIGYFPWINVFDFCQQLNISTPLLWRFPPKISVVPCCRKTLYSSSPSCSGSLAVPVLASSLAAYHPHTDDYPVNPKVSPVSYVNTDWHLQPPCSSCKKVMLKRDACGNVFNCLQRIALLCIVSAVHLGYPRLLVRLHVVKLIW